MKINHDKVWSIEAEAAVLGSMLWEPNCIPGVMSELDAKAFYKPEHQTICGAIFSLFIDKVPVDAISLRTKLKELNQLERVGGVKYIKELLDSPVSTATVMYYASVVKDRQRYRQIVRLVEKMQDIPNEPITTDEMLEEIQSRVLSLDRAKPAELHTFKDDVEIVEAEQQESISYIRTGLRNIDNIAGGISRGELGVIAGRPNMGKSALALTIAVNMAKVGLAIIFFSLEMTYKALIKRALKREESASLKELDFVLYEGADTPEKQIAFIRNRKQMHKVDVVFVDYLQLMNTGGKNENRVQEISIISRKLKLAAIAEDIPIIALSQLNRAVENREGHRPRLSDLRESGAIEQDADIVMLLHREDYYRLAQNPNAPQDGSTEVIIAKNRRGPTGIAQLVFLDEKVTFGDRIAL